MSKKRGQPKPNHKAFWVTLWFIFFLSAISIVFLSKDSSLIGAATQTVSYMKAGEDLFFEVKVDGVQYATVTFSKDVKDMVITTEQINNTLFNGTVYSIFKMYSSNDNNIQKVEFTFKISEQELNNIGLNKNEVKVYKESQELPTTLTRIEAGYAYYTATAPNVGEFVIGKKAAPVAALVVIPSSPLPEVTPQSAVETAPQPETAAAQPETQQPEAQPLVGRAAEQEESAGVFQKTVDFFKNLFK